MNDFLPMAVFLGTIYGIVKLSMDYKIKKRLIEKGDNNFDLNSLSKNGPGYAVLMWAMILISLAAAILLGFLFFPEIRMEATSAMMLGLSGFSMIVYFVISKILDRKKK
ncbi:hypothetical protein JXL83_08430 [candidate division WOR-3 bacterium]|nr:hypothetical protein [candidate division WOR-3 bacterium]